MIVECSQIVFVVGDGRGLWRISGFGRDPWGGNQICSPPSFSFPNTHSLCNIGPTLSYYRKLRIPAQCRHVHVLFTLTCNSVEVHGTAAQKTVLQDISISLLTSFCSKMGWLVWLVQIFPLAESFGHWITVTGEEPPSAWLFQRKIYRSTFGSNFKNVLKPAIYPQQSRSANGGEPQFSGGTIALMAHQRSSSSLLSGLDVSRLEPYRLGLSPIHGF